MTEFVENQDSKRIVADEKPEGLVQEALAGLKDGIPKEMINKLDDPTKLAQQLLKDRHIGGQLAMVLGHMDDEKAAKLVNDINQELKKLDEKLVKEGKNTASLSLDYSSTTKFVDFGKDQGQYAQSTLSLSEKNKVIESVKVVDQWEDRQRRQSTADLKSQSK